LCLFFLIFHNYDLLADRSIRGACDCCCNHLVFSLLVVQKRRRSILRRFSQSSDSCVCRALAGSRLERLGLMSSSIPFYDNRSKSTQAVERRLIRADGNNALGIIYSRGKASRKKSCPPRIGGMGASLGVIHFPNRIPLAPLVLDVHGNYLSDDELGDNEEEGLSKFTPRRAYACTVVGEMPGQQPLGEGGRRSESDNRVCRSMRERLSPRDGRGHLDTKHKVAE
jgi:hypothetical protein